VLTIDQRITDVLLVFVNIVNVIGSPIGWGSVAVIDRMWISRAMYRGVSEYTVGDIEKLGKGWRWRSLGEKGEKPWLEADKALLGCIGSFAPIFLFYHQHQISITFSYQEPFM
jgi:hypothetical protein